VNRPPTCLAAATSRPNRIRKSGSAASSSRMTFTATSRPPADRPRNTRPMPPLPSRPTSRYGPTCCGSPRCSSCTTTTPPGGSHGNNVAKHGYSTFCVAGLPRVSGRAQPIDTCCQWPDGAHLDDLPAAVEASAEVVWRTITEPGQMTQWFARLAAGAGMAGRTPHRPVAAARGRTIRRSRPAGR
jgi:hypothetical protein